MTTPPSHWLVESEILPKAVESARFLKKKPRRGKSYEVVWGAVIDQRYFASLLCVESVFQRMRQLPPASSPATISCSFVVQKGPQEKLTSNNFRHLSSHSSKWFETVIAAIKLKRQQCGFHGQGPSSDWASGLFAASYGYVMSAPDEVFEVLSIPRDCLLDVISLCSSYRHLPWVEVAINVHSFMRKWSFEKLYDAAVVEELGKPHGQGPNPTTSEGAAHLSSLSHYILEVLGVAVICRVVGISESTTDLKSIRSFLTGPLTKAAGTIVDYLIAIIKVLYSGDWTDFTAKVSSMVYGSRKDILMKCGIVTEEALRDTFIKGSEEHRAKVSFALRFVRNSILSSKKVSCQFDVLHLMALEKKLMVVNAEINTFKRMREPRKEPLAFFNKAAPGVGKSIFSTFVLAGVAKAYGIAPEDAYLVHHFFADEKYQENYGDHIMVVTMDEVFSLVHEVDDNLSVAARTILSWCSSNPISVPMAFEGGKGTVTTANLKVLIMNSNAETEDLAHIFKRGAAALYRRVFMVDMKLKQESKIRHFDGTTKLDGVDPSVLTPEFLNDQFTIELRKYRVRQDTGMLEWSVETMSPFQLTEFVYRDMLDRSEGKWDKISNQLSSYLKWEPNVIIEKNSDSDLVIVSKPDSVGQSPEPRPPFVMSWTLYIGVWLFIIMLWIIVIGFYGFLLAGLMATFSDWYRHGWRYVWAQARPYWYMISFWLGLQNVLMMLLPIQWALMVYYLFIAGFQNLVDVFYEHGYLAGVREGAIAVFANYTVAGSESDLPEVRQARQPLARAAWHKRFRQAAWRYELRREIDLHVYAMRYRLWRTVGGTEPSEPRDDGEIIPFQGQSASGSSSDVVELRARLNQERVSDYVRIGASGAFLLAVFGVFWLYPWTFVVTFFYVSFLSMIACHRWFAVCAWTYVPFLRSTIVGHAIAGQAALFTVDHYDWAYRVARRRFDKMQLLVRSRYFMGMSAMAGFAALSYGVAKIVTREPELVATGGIGQGGAFCMPKKFDSSEYVELDGKVVDFLGAKVRVKEFGKSDGMIRQLVPSGGGMTADIIIKIRQGYLRLEILEIDGKPRDEKYRDCVSYAIRTLGFAEFIDHIVPPDAKEIVVKLECPYSARIVENVRVTKDEWTRIGEKFFIPTLFPTGVKSMLRVMNSSRTPKQGDKVILLGLERSKDLEGVVTRVGICAYVTEFGERRTPGAVIQWDEGRTIMGDCKRICLIISGGQYNFAGTLMAGKDGESYIDLAPPGGYAAFLESIRSKAISQGLGWMDSDVVYEEPPFEIVRKMPIGGMFAYSHTRDTVGAWVLGSSPSQGAPPGSRLRNSPFKTEAEEALKLHCPGKEYAPAVLETTIRYDDDLKCNRYVSPFEVGMNRSGYEVGTFSVKTTQKVIQGMKEMLFPHIRDLEMLSLDESLESFGQFSRVDPNKGANELEPGKKGTFIYEFQGEDGEATRYVDDRVRTAVSENIFRLASGLVTPSFSKSMLKDELLAKSKVEKVATRVFELQGFRFYLTDRMVLGPGLDLFIKAMKMFGSKIGINASSEDWGKVKSKLDEVLADGGSILEADFGKFDKRFQFWIHMMIKELKFWFIMLCYKKKLESVLGLKVLERIVGGCLVQNMLVIRLVDGAWIWFYGGNLTGHFSTTDENTLENFILWAMVILTLFPDLTFRDVVTRVCGAMNLYGDDQLVGIPKSMSDVLTIDRLRVEMAKFGQDITGVGFDKGKMVSSENWTFLKRGFHRDEETGLVFPCLAMSSIFKSMLMYEPCGDDKQDRFRHFTVLRTAWEEALFHPPAMKRAIRDVVLQCLKKVPEFGNSTFESDEVLVARFKSGSLRVWDLVI